MKDYDESILGLIHSVYTGGMVDGPGIRTIIFLAGCSLRCLYCHNPDTWYRMRGNKKTVKEMLEEIKKYSAYYKFSGGGVTISGGEPTDQPYFLKELLKACRASGIHTVLDTSGFANTQAAEDILPYVSLLLLDIKSFDPKTYTKLTSSKIERPLSTLDMAQRLKIPTWVRFVLVPGVTDDMGEIRKMAAFLKGFDVVQKVEVLPFHKHGEYKWQDLGYEYALAGVEPPAEGVLREVQEVFGEGDI
ncbi:MAG: pyruvate formate-lyase-activating protein [Defluviitaleaceae bacterium]|nr:pyruvate formate-lyase-activating protein [Defluviitaleaceae bacterium]